MIINKLPVLRQSFCFAAAPVFYVSARMPYLFIGFGCAFLCFGFVCLSKAKRDRDE